MNTKLIAAGAFTGLALTGGMVGMVSAQSAADATSLTEEQVIAIALAEIPGEVTEVELEREDGAMIYEVEIMADNGTEMEIEIAAETGAVLLVEAEGHDCGDDEDDDDEA